MNTYKTNRELVGMPSEKHRMFYEYLWISPSYYLAHQIRRYRKKVAPKDLPVDFDKVLAIYDRAGNVYNYGFDDWWDKYGVNLLATDPTRAKVLYQVNLMKPKEKILNDFKNYIEQINFQPFNPIQSKIYFEKNKMRISTLIDRHNMVLTRSSYLDNKTSETDKKVPYWKMPLGQEFRSHIIPMMSNINLSKAVKEIKVEERKKKRRSNKVKKAYVTMVFSKNLKEALYISENASRGKFPSKDPLIDCLDFNFSKLPDIEVQMYINHDKMWTKKLEQGFDLYVKDLLRNRNIHEEKRKIKRRSLKRKEISDRNISFERFDSNFGPLQD